MVKHSRSRYGNRNLQFGRSIYNYEDLTSVFRKEIHTRYRIKVRDGSSSETKADQSDR